MPVPVLLRPGGLKVLSPGGDPILQEIQTNGSKDELPVDIITKWHRVRIPELGNTPRGLCDRVMIVRAGTGSGKSTTLPYELFRIYHDPRTTTQSEYNKGLVFSAQPRRYTAMEIAKEISGQPHFPGLKIGLNLGYTTGVRDERPRRGLIFGTAGVLQAKLRMQTAREFAEEFRVVILDEVHEQSKDLNVIMMLLKAKICELLAQGSSKVPFVYLTSATFDVHEAQRFWSDAGGEAPIVDVAGATFPIEDHWPKVGTNDVVAAAVPLIMELNSKSGDDPLDDILVFLAGKSDMKKLVAAVEKSITARPQLRPGGNPWRPLRILIVTGDDVKNESPSYQLVMVDYTDPRLEKAQRLILATNVAETGLTVPTVRHVIDSGWMKSTEYFPDYSLSGLVQRPVAQSRVRQRRGRAGRKYPGHFWPLYTKNTHDHMDVQQYADTITQGCCDIMLDILAVVGGETPARSCTDEKLLNVLMTVPPHQSIVDALSLLHRCSLIQPTGKLTQLGELTRLSPAWIRGVYPVNAMVESAIRLGIPAAEICEIAAILEVGKPACSREIMKARGNQERVWNALTQHYRCATFPWMESEFGFEATYILLQDDILLQLMLFQGWSDPEAVAETKDEAWFFEVLALREDYLAVATEMGASLEQMVDTPLRELPARQVRDRLQRLKMCLSEVLPWVHYDASTDRVWLPPAPNRIEAELEPLSETTMLEVKSPAPPGLLPFNTMLTTSIKFGRSPVVQDACGLIELAQDKDCQAFVRYRAEGKMMSYLDGYVPRGYNTFRKKLDFQSLAPAEKTARLLEHCIVHTKTVSFVDQMTEERLKLFFGTHLDSIHGRENQESRSE